MGCNSAAYCSAVQRWVDDASPIQVGTEGIWKNSAFVVTGRIIYEYENGGWNEWHLSFNDGSSAGKIQWGSAWWFLDQKDGMEKQLNTLSNMSLLSRFVGMLTDSRSFLSFCRPTAG